MSIQISNDDTRFTCYINGSEKTCSFIEAWRLLWNSNIGYLVPLAYYRYRIGDHADAFYFPQRNIRKAETEFAFELHRRRCTAVTLDDFDSRHEDGREFQQNTLNARCSRFFRAAYPQVPEQMRPYEVIALPGPGHRMRSGYLLQVGVTCCMIVDQVWSGPVRPYFDWSQFLDPPTGDQLRPSA